MPLGSKRQREASSGGGASAAPGSGGRAPAAGERGTMIPARSRRSRAESFLMRIVATAGIVGICVAIAAIMGSSNTEAWIIGLVASLISVVLAGVLWSSRRL